MPDIPAGVQTSPPIDREQWLHIYQQMTKIRVFEETANELYMTAKMPGLTHLYIGEEAIAVGVCEALRQDDYITSTHRGHGHCIAKGAEMSLMFAELLGKSSGYCRGKGGSMHIADLSSGNLGANAITGGSAGIAAGAAMSAKMRGTDQVAVCFFGEGALGQGLFYEVWNMAKLWNLPVIYVCENNQYNEYTHFSEVTGGDLLERARGFGFHTEEIDGQDVKTVYTTMLRLVAQTRAGGSPVFLMCHTYRFFGHHVGDINREYYRPKEEEMYWKQNRDPIKLFGQWLLDQHIADTPLLEGIQSEVRQDAAAALKFGMDAPFPDPGEVSLHVYA